MFFRLIKSFDGAQDYYGEISQYTEEGYSKNTEYYQIETDEERDLLLSDFMNPINNLCGTPLDYGDVDWFSAENCVKLKEWLDDRMQQPCDERLRKLYFILHGYASRAIELNTSVVVEL